MKSYPGDSKAQSALNITAIDNYLIITFLKICYMSVAITNFVEKILLKIGSYAVAGDKIKQLFKRRGRRVFNVKKGIILLSYCILLKISNTQQSYSTNFVIVKSFF